MKKIIMAILITISVLASSLEASAEAFISCPSCGYEMPLYDKVLLYQEKTGEHTVYINGKQAICFIYTEYYENIYYCTTCQKYKSTTEIRTDVHSLNQ